MFINSLMMIVFIMIVCEYFIFLPLEMWAW